MSFIEKINESLEEIHCEKEVDDRKNHQQVMNDLSSLSSDLDELFKNF